MVPKNLWWSMSLRPTSPAKAHRCQIPGLCAMVAILLFWPQILSADVIYLKSGGKIEGVVSSETESEVIIRTHGGLLTISRKKIKKLVRSGDQGNSELVEKQKAAEEAEAARPELVKPDPTPHPDAPAAPPKEASGRDLLGELSKETTGLPGRDLVLKLRVPEAWLVRSDEAARLTVASRPASEGEPRGRALLWTMEVGRRTLGQAQAFFVQTIKDAYKLESVPAPTVVNIGGRAGIELRFDKPERGSIRAILVETGVHGKLGIILECELGQREKFDRCLDSMVGTLAIESP